MISIALFNFAVLVEQPETICKYMVVARIVTYKNWQLAGFGP